MFTYRSPEEQAEFTDRLYASEQDSADGVCLASATFEGPVYDTPARCTLTAGHVGYHHCPGRLAGQPYRWLDGQPVERLLWGTWSAA